MSKSVITDIRREKMAEASRSGKLARITHIALGSGGVDGNGAVIEPLAGDVQLRQEVLRREYDTCTKISDTSYEYALNLGESELVGTYISELALIDEDGDVAAFSNFLARGKDDTMVTFAVEDSY